MQVRVTGADGEQHVSGEGVSTWTERVFEQVTSFTLAWTEHVEAPSLPVSGAVLWAGSLTWGEPAPAGRDRDEPASQPVPAPPAQTAAGPEENREPAGPDSSGGPDLTTSPETPKPARPEPAAGEDDPQAPEPTAVFPVSPPAPSDSRPGGQPRPGDTGSQTLPEVDWEMPAPPVPPPRPPADQESPRTPADLLGGPVWDAPAGQQDAEANSPAGPGSWAGAHGGDTESSPNLGAKLLGRLLGTPTDEGEPTVPALICDNDHPNPPQTSFCSRCGRRLSGPPRRVPRPSLGLLTLADGQVVVLTRSVIVGRSPSPDRSSTPDTPQLVTVPSPDQEISRSHVEICLEGWTVLARDLGSSNGTLLVRQGEEPVKLPQTSPLQLRSGDVLDLGEDVRLSLSELA